jgi:hypothetical protein
MLSFEPAFAGLVRRLDAEHGVVSVSIIGHRAVIEDDCPGADRTVRERHAFE